MDFCIEKCCSRTSPFVGRLYLYTMHCVTTVSLSACITLQYLTAVLTLTYDDISYTIIELGARYATWAVRGALAHRRLWAQHGVDDMTAQHVIVGEIDTEVCGWCKQHGESARQVTHSVSVIGID